MKPVVPCCLVLSLLAGCLGDPAPQASDLPEPTTVVAEFSDDLGAIEGVVVDESLLPLADARVTLTVGNGFRDLVAATATTVDGRFAFSLLAPAEYRVLAEVADHGNASRFVRVVAGAAERVELQLNPVGATTPYVSVQIRNGNIACYLALSVVGATPCPNGGQGTNKFYFDVPAQHRLVVVQTDWAQRSSVLNMDVALAERDGTAYVDGRSLDYVKGRPILRADYTPQQAGTVTNVIQTTPATFPESDESLSLIVRLYYMGSYLYDETNSAAATYCRGTASGACPGVGLAADLRYTNYVSAFIHEAPGDGALYSAVPDS